MAKLPPSKQSPTLKPLNAFQPFCDLPESTQILMTGFAEVKHYQSGDVLFTAGINDEVDYFLLDGEVLLRAEGEVDTLIKSQSSKANMALGVLRPRQLSAQVRSFYSTFYVVPHSVLMMVYEQTRKVASVTPVLEVVIGDVPKDTLLERVEKEIVQGRLLLVSLPEVALKVKNACDDPDSELENIAGIINRDASIAIKISQAANSPLYRGASEVKTVMDAVCRLGKKLTQHLVFYFATQELFQSPVKSLEMAFRYSWEDAVKRAVMAHTIATLSRGQFNPDIAFLSGLLFRIGDLLILQYIAGHTDEAQELNKIQQISEKESAANSKLVVSKWDLPESITHVLDKGGDWSYQSSQQGDYTDLIITTNLFLRVKNKNMVGLPKFDQVPAMSKILNKGFAVNASIMVEYRKALSAFKLM